MDVLEQIRNILEVNNDPNPENTLSIIRQMDESTQAFILQKLENIIDNNA